MKSLLGNSPGGQNEMLGLANAFTGGYMDTPVNRINACFVSISEDLSAYKLHIPSLTLKNHCQLNSPLA